MVKLNLKLKIISFSFFLIILILFSTFFAVRYFVKALYFNDILTRLEKNKIIFENHQQMKRNFLISQGILMADLPKFKAAIDTGDIHTIENVAESYQYLLPNDLILITDKNGNILARMGDAEQSDFPSNISHLASVKSSLTFGREETSLWSLNNKLYEIVVVPFFIEQELTGLLIIGFLINNQSAEELRSMIDSEVIFFLDSRVVATSLSEFESLKSLNFQENGHKGTAIQIDMNGESYLLSKNSLNVSNSMKTSYYITLYSIRSYNVFLKSLTLIFISIAGGVFLFAFLFSFITSGAITNPLRNATRFMTEINRSEDLTKKLEIKTSDRDVKIMVETFNRLIKSLNQAKKETEESYLSAIEAMVTALDSRDNETAGHSQRVKLYTRKITKAMGIDSSKSKLIERAALLHDIGKIGIPDSILRKPGNLSEEEWEIMRKHPFIGYVMLQKIEFLKKTSEIVYSHHERYDGTGYPRGLKEKEILLGARLFAVVDAFDAMTTERPHRKIKSFEEARQEISRFSGVQFDPKVVDAFLKVPDGTWMRIRNKVQVEYVPTIETIRIE